MTEIRDEYVVYRKGREVIAIPNKDNLIVALLDDHYSFECYLGECSQEELLANPPKVGRGLQVNRVYKVLDEDDGWQDSRDLGTGEEVGYGE